MEQIYFGGTILTMEEELLAESILVKDGWIEAVGPKEELMASYSKAVPVDLHHCTMMPAFIDSHSHFFAVANGYLEVDLEGVEDFQEIRERVREFIKKNQVQKGNWVKAKGYDHNTLREKKHPDRTFLDQCAPDNPFVMQHKSGHVGVFNSLGLEKLGVTEDTPEPEGGRIGKANGKLTGYMEETAFVSYLRKTPIPGAEEMKRAAMKAQDFYASYGIATVQDGMSVVQMIPLYEQLIKEEKLKLDLVVYPEKNALAAFREKMPKSYRQYHGHFKINGMKIFLDGSPQARTAWMEEPYVGETTYCGYGTMEDEGVTEAFLAADREKCQLLAHCNGDRACRQYLECAANAKRKGADLKDMRPVMIHAQFLP